MLQLSGNLKVRFEHWPLVWLWPVGLALMQMSFTTVEDFTITAGVIICHFMQLYLVAFYWLHRPSDRQVIVVLAALTYCLVMGLFADDPAEFFRSFAHITNLLLMITICMNVRLTGMQRQIRRSIAVLCCLAMAVAGLVIAQSLSYNLFGDLSLTRLLGDYSPRIGLQREIYAPHLLSPVKRANAWFSEPSVAAWFLAFATALALAARRLQPRLSPVTALVCSAGAIATLSLTGVVGTSTVLAGYLLFVRDRGDFKLIWGLAAGLGLALALYVTHELGILARFERLHEPGTSVYFRLTAPLRLLAESLPEFPFGHPVGQTGFIAAQSYYVNWDGGSQTNIDNTLFVIVFYFGMLGILCNATYLVQLLKYLVIRRQVVGLIMLGLLVGLGATGAGWAHHFVLMIGYAIVVGRYLHARRLVRPRPIRAQLQALIRRRSDASPARGRLSAARPRAPWRLADGAP